MVVMVMVMMVVTVLSLVYDSCCLRFVESYRGEQNSQHHSLSTLHWLILVSVRLEKQKQQPKQQLWVLSIIREQFEDSGAKRLETETVKGGGD